MYNLYMYLRQVISKECNKKLKKFLDFDSHRRKLDPDQYGRLKNNESYSFGSEPWLQTEYFSFTLFLYLRHSIYLGINSTRSTNLKFQGHSIQVRRQGKRSKHKISQEFLHCNKVTVSRFLLCPSCQRRPGIYSDRRRKVVSLQDINTGDTCTLFCPILGLKKTVGLQRWSINIGY